MKTIPLLCCLLATSAAAAPIRLPGWELIWNDEFNGRKTDSNKWSPCDRGKSDWNNTMTRDPRCFEIGGGTLRLIGIVNPDTSKDPSPFLTGGLTSKDKFSFRHGKIVIRARFKPARGAWPALWMLGTDGRWPHNGEIDLMEHLNFDDKVYQTVHSGYTHSPEGRQGPPKGTTAPIDRDNWNTYGAEWDAEKIVFTVNGKPTMTYPKVPEKGSDQWPFDQPFYLIFSMQIGGKWVGKADPADYPAHLEIDWVRVYRKPEARSRRTPPKPSCSSSGHHDGMPRPRGANSNPRTQLVSSTNHQTSIVRTRGEFAGSA